MSLKRTATLLLLLFVVWSSNTSNAQYFGGNTPLTKWRSINTDTVRIIFPAGLEQEATRAANVIGFIAKNRTATVGPKVAVLHHRHRALRFDEPKSEHLDARKRRWQTLQAQSGSRQC